MNSCTTTLITSSLVKQCKLTLVGKTEKDVIFEMEQPVTPTESILEESLCMQHSLSSEKIGKVIRISLKRQKKAC